MNEDLNKRYDSFQFIEETKDLKKESTIVKPIIISPYDNVIKNLSQLKASDFVEENIEEYKKVINELFLLYRVSRVLNSVLDLDVLLKQSMDLIFEVINAECGFIFLFEEKDKEKILIPRYVKYRDEIKPNKEEPIKISKTIINKVVDEKVSVLTSDALSDPRFTGGESIVFYNIRSAMSVPLWSRNKIIGIIHLDNRKTINVFKERDLDILIVLANHIAISIDNARLYKILESKVDLANKELRKTNELLLESKEKIQAVIESITDPLIVIDVNKMVILINEKANAIMPELNIGDNISTSIKNYSLLELFEETLSRGTSTQKEIVFNLPEGEKVYRALISNISCNRESIGAVAVLMDITKFKEMDELKNEFISHVSHELRTPLTSIKAYLEILMDGVNNKDEEAKYLKIIDEESERLTRLIEDLLIVSRIESKKLTLHLKQVSIRKIIEKVLNILYAKAKEKNIYVMPDFPEENINIICDEDKIGEVLINIIGNALKYSYESGKIEIIVYKENDKVCIKIKDEGIGISTEDQQNLFKKFFRSERKEIRDIGGTGLGLYISKKIIEAHLGFIVVESKFGEGSTFIIKLPLIL